MTAKHPMIPFPVIVRAADGDIEAVNQICTPLQRFYCQPFHASHERRIWEYPHGCR